MDQVGKFYKEQYDISKPKLEARTLELEKSAEQMESWLKREIDPSIELRLSLERLDSLVASYFYDIIRYKSFHGMLDSEGESKVNLQKIYAYTTKWILREKPLYALRDDLKSLMEKDNKAGKQYIFFANNINERWALTWIESSYYAQTNKRLNLAAQSTDIYYSMQYRDFSVAWFEHLLDSEMNHEVLEQL